MNNVNQNFGTVTGICAQSPSMLVPEDSPKNYQRNDRQRAPRDAKVMIVDDESINIEIVKAYLEEEGFGNFITTTNSTQAVGMVRQLEPDIVLLDINMPQVTGLEILEAMRRDQDLMMIPTVILTAANDPRNQTKGTTFRRL